MMIRFANYLTMAAIGLATLGMTTEAHAHEVIVRVDNWTNPSKYSNAKSSGSLRVCVRFKANTPGGQLVNYAGSWMPRYLCETKTLEVIASDWNYDFDTDDDVYSIHGVDRIEMFFGETGNATDLLVVDQFDLRGGNTVRKTFGSDNETGYCFSSDTDDADNTHCNSFNGTAWQWNF